MPVKNSKLKTPAFAKASAGKQKSKVSKKEVTSVKSRLSSPKPQTMEELLAQTGYEIKVFKQGDLVEGEIVSLAPREVLLDIGGKSPGIVAERELEFLKDLLKSLKVGDKVRAFVLNPENDRGQIILSLRKASADFKWKKLAEKKEKDETLEVKGIEANKGGLITDFEGLRGFIPASQLEVSFVGSPQNLINKTFPVKILEADPSGNRLIFSQRLAAVRDVAVQKKKLEKIKIGETYEGIVTAVFPFGAFVNVEGIEGLVHISEIAWEKVGDPKEYLKIGEQVKVMVVGMDKNLNRLNLSIKQLTPDPWQEMAKKYSLKELVKGRVTKLTNFGAFVRLDQGIDGLIHISKIPPQTELKEGDEVECLVETITPEQRKISLSLVLKEKPIGYK